MTDETLPLLDDIEMTELPPGCIPGWHNTPDGAVVYMGNPPRPVRLQSQDPDDRKIAELERRIRRLEGGADDE